MESLDCSSVARPRQAIDLDTGTFESSTTTIILYIVRLCARVDNYVSFLLSYDDGTHDSIRGKPFRGLELSDGARPRLEAAQRELRVLLHEQFRATLLGWHAKLARGSCNLHVTRCTLHVTR